MAAMTELADLTAEVRFRERLRGYDHEEVDDYVKTVNHTTAQALGRISELQERVRRLESRQEGDAGTDEERETLVRTLVLAQRAADTAVAEARLQAKAITDEATESAAATVSEAEAAAAAQLRTAADEAARVLAEGEENCRLIIAETKRTAAAEMAAERERALEELQALTEAKAELSAETARIGARLEHERARMQEFLASFRAFVEATAAASAGAGIEIHEGSESHAASEAATSEAAMPPASEEVQAEMSRPEPPEQAQEAAGDESLAGDGSLGDEALATRAESHGEPRDEPEAGSGPAAEADRAWEQSDRQAGSSATEPTATEPTATEFTATEFTTTEPMSTEPTATEFTSTEPTSTEPVPEVPLVRWLEDTESQDAGEQLPLSGDVRGSLEHPSADAPGGGPETASVPVSLATQAWPVTESWPPGLFDAGTDEDDEFVQQLRRVVNSDAPSPDRDEAMSAFFDHDDSGSGDRGSGFTRTANTNWVTRRGRRS